MCYKLSESCALDSFLMAAAPIRELTAKQRTRHLDCSYHCCLFCTKHFKNQDFLVRHIRDNHAFWIDSDDCSSDSDSDDEDLTAIRPRCPYCDEYFGHKILRESHCLLVHGIAFSG